MQHFFDVHGNLHITIRSDLTKALGWAKVKYDNEGNPIPNEQNGGPVESHPVCLEINYSDKNKTLNENCNVIINTKSKSMSDHE
jgi:hypothetical protein